MNYLNITTLENTDLKAVENPKLAKFRCKRCPNIYYNYHQFRTKMTGRMTMKIVEAVY